MSACYVCGKWLDPLPFEVRTEESGTEIPRVCGKKCADRAPIRCDCGAEVQPEDWPLHYDACQDCQND